MLRMWIPPVEVDPLESASVLLDITFPLLLKTSGLLFTGICKYSGWLRFRKTASHSLFIHSFMRAENFVLQNTNTYIRQEKKTVEDR